MSTRILYILFLLASALSSSQVRGQDPHFTQASRIPTWYNPAAAGHGVEHIRLTMLYRNQWSSVMSPFKTQGLFFDKQVSKVGFGANLVNNSSGDAGIRQFFLNGQLSYRLKFGKHALASGVQVGFIQKSFDPSKMTFDDQYTSDQGFNPANPTSESFSYTTLTRPDFGVGMLWTYGKQGKDQLYPYAGLSIQHLNQPKESFIEQDNIIPRKFSAQAGVGIWVRESWFITPAILFTQQQFAKELQSSITVRLPLEDRNQVEGGLIFRNKDAIALYAGYQWNSFMAGMSYDVNISGATGGPGAFELSLTYIPKAKVKKEEAKKKSKTTAKADRDSKDKDGKSKPTVTESKAKAPSAPAPKEPASKKSVSVPAAKNTADVTVSGTSKPTITKPAVSSTAKPATNGNTIPKSGVTKEPVVKAPVNRPSAPIPATIPVPQPKRSVVKTSNGLTPLVIPDAAETPLPVVSAPLQPMEARKNGDVPKPTITTPSPLRAQAVNTTHLSPVVVDDVAEEKPTQAATMPVQEMVVRSSYAMPTNVIIPDAPIKVESGTTNGMKPVTTAEEDVDESVKVQDADNDGIADKDDKCPYMKGEISTGGCPDTDQDGITDMEDLCPLVKGSKDNNGCAEKEISDLSERTTYHSGNIEFKTGSTEVHGLYKLDIIEPALDSLLENNNLALVITGHTDDEGDAMFNMQLSQARADVVKAIFIRKGLDEERITTVAYGENMPIRDNISPDGRKRNRRVEIHVMRKK
jgi:type IX secretion system PorP/SprF family membrane protein